MATTEAIEGIGVSFPGTTNDLANPATSYEKSLKGVEANYARDRMIDDIREKNKNTKFFCEQIYYRTETRY